MILKEIGNIKLDKEVIRQDRKDCVRINNHGIGKEAIYLGNYFFARCNVIPIKCIIRVFKRIAMSKGGFTGKGIFASIPYVVVVCNNGEEIQATLKDEILADNFIDYIKEHFPLIKTLSLKQEETIEQSKKEREARKVKNLSDVAKKSIEELKDIKGKLLSEKDVYRQYSVAAKERRSSMLAKDVYIYFLWVILVFGIIVFAYGIYAVIQKQGMAIYTILFGFAIIFFFVSMQILPTQKYNKKSILERYKKAKQNAVLTTQRFIKEDFPIPPKYVHFSTISRLIAGIEEGKGETIDTAYKRFVEELKKMNKDVSLYPDEYEEIMDIKPIYLVENYSE